MTEEINLEPVRCSYCNVPNNMNIIGSLGGLLIVKCVCGMSSFLQLTQGTIETGKPKEVNYTG